MVSNIDDLSYLISTLFSNNKFSVEKYSWVHGVFVDDVYEIIY